MTLNEKNLNSEIETTAEYGRKWGTEDSKRKESQFWDWNITMNLAIVESVYL